MQLKCSGTFSGCQGANRHQATTFCRCRHLQGTSPLLCAMPGWCSSRMTSLLFVPLPLYTSHPYQPDSSCLGSVPGCWEPSLQCTSHAWFLLWQSWVPGFFQQTPDSSPYHSVYSVLDGNLMQSSLQQSLSTPSSFCYSAFCGPAHKSCHPGQ